MKSFTSTAAAVVLTLIFGIQPVLAVSTNEIVSYPGFDPNFILTDSDIFDANSLSFDRLVAFMRSRGSLAGYRLKDIDGVEKSAADIIWRVAQSYKINPKYLLALLQKEQSLVEDPNPSSVQFDWATGYGICDTCSKDSPSVQEFKGFASQVEWAAKQHREKYLFQLLSIGLTVGGQGIGNAVYIDGAPVTPANHATAMLYSYTPHLKGNFNLWKIWQRWFGLVCPDNTVVKGEPSGKTYLIKFGEKRAYASPAVFSSLVIDPEKVVAVPDLELEKYPDGSVIKFSKYSLLRDPDGKIYLLTGESKRHIADMAAFRKFGFNLDEVQKVEFADLENYPDGPKINAGTAFPQGILLKTHNLSTVWYVEDGTRHALADGVLLRLYFPRWRIREVSQDKLESYPAGEPYLLRDGELVKTLNDSTVYVVENRLLRPIPSAEIFENIGWEWKNIVVVPESVIKIHAAGLPFESPIQKTALKS